MNSSPQQVWNSDRYAENAPYVPALGQPVLDLLTVRPGERILDLGCGDGVLTEKIAALGAEVVGVDSSQDMVDAARRRGLAPVWRMNIASPSITNLTPCSAMPHCTG
jgi:2-polyprenyl-3-methyl-5-hydroxy-6-metoxy-1,4-benzoquinol methylase